MGRVTYSKDKYNPPVHLRATIGILILFSSQPVGVIKIVTFSWERRIKNLKTCSLNEAKNDVIFLIIMTSFVFGNY